MRTERGESGVAGALRGGEGGRRAGERTHALGRGEAEWLSASATAQHQRAAPDSMCTVGPGGHQIYISF